MALDFSTLRRPANPQVVDPSTGRMREEWQFYFDQLTTRLNGAVGELGVDPVLGPGSATDNAVARFDGTTGKLIQSSGVTIDDSDNIAIPGRFALTWTGNDAATVATIDAGGSSISNSSAFTVTVPATGSQKGFQVTTPGAIASWVSCELSIGGTGKAGFAIGPGSGVRDTNLYRNAADTWKTDDSLIIGGTLTASATIELGNASDTTLSRLAAGVAAVEGKEIVAPASPAQGDVAYYNGSSWVRLAAGTSGQFLKTNGAAANPAWAYASGVLIASGTISSLANLDIALNGQAWDEVEIQLAGLQGQNSTATLQAQFSQSGSFLSGAGNYIWANDRGGTATQSTGDTVIRIIDDFEESAEGRHGSLIMKIIKPGTASIQKSLLVHGFIPDDSANQYFGLNGGGSLIANTNAIDAVRIFFSTGNLQAGYYQAIGRKYA